jgi:hypothetical protein
MLNEHVGSISNDITPWVGTIAKQDIGLWVDYALLLLLGGVPWHSYFQRVSGLITSLMRIIISITIRIPALLYSIVELNHAQMID